MSKSLVLVFGSDEYLVADKARSMVDGYLPAEERLMALDIVDGAASTADGAADLVSKCLGSVLSPPFFTKSKVTWFRDVNFLYESNVGKAEAVKTALERFVGVVGKGIPQGQMLIVTSPKVDKRYAFYKAFKDKGEVHEFEVPDKAYLAERQVKDRVIGFLGEREMQMDEAALELFLDRVGSDSRQIVNELEKLLSYTGGRKKITAADIKAITSSSRSALAWDLSDAVGNQDLKEATAVLRQLVFQKEEPVGLMVLLETRIRELLLYRQALDSGWLREKSSYGKRSYQWGEVPADVDKLFTELFSKDPRQVHPFRVGLLAEQARRFPAKKLVKCYHALAAASEKIVSTRVPPEVTMELLLVEMLS